MPKIVSVGLQFWVRNTCPLLVVRAERFYLNGRPETVAQIASLALNLLTLWALWACYVRISRECVIKMQRRSERHPFFIRNQDQLIMMFVAALVGGCVTFAGVALKEHFYPLSTRH